MVRVKVRAWKFSMPVNVSTKMGFFLHVRVCVFFLAAKKKVG